MPAPSSSGEPVVLPRGLASRSHDVVAAVRRAIGRHRWVGRGLVLAAAIGASWSFLVVSQAEEQAAARWERTVRVWVADGGVEPGDTIVASPLAVPVRVVPPTAAAGDPSGVIARQRVAVGEIVVEHDLAIADGPAALAPDGTTVVAVPDVAAPLARPGVAVALSSEGVLLTDEGVVTAVDDGVVLVAVPDGVAPLVAAAAQQRLASVLFPAGD